MKILSTRDGLLSFKVAETLGLSRSKFWRNTRTEKHRPDGDPLNTDPPNPNPPPLQREGRNPTCEFCGCQLTPRGEIIKMGDLAKSVRKHEEAIEAKEKEIRRLTEEIAEFKRQLQAATPSPAQSGRRVGALVE